jgi:dinuclear metal center YbgI/SA1388 family protein
VVDTVGAWVGLLEDLYPSVDAFDWDRPGLQVGDPGWPVRRVLVTLDVTTAVLDEAAAVEGTLVIAHHPLLMHPLHALTPGTVRGRLALRAAVDRIAVAAAHTNLDAATDGAGTSDPVVELLSLVDVRPLCAPARPEARQVGRVGDLPGPMSLGEVARMIAEQLPAPHLRLVGSPDRMILRVAVLGGSGASAVEDAIASGADVLVTGDVRHHAALDALESGLALIDAGHHATEVAAMPAFASRLAAAADAAGLRAQVARSIIDTVPWELP